MTAGYFRLLEPQLVAGRLPTDAELTTGAGVAVVSERVARAYWADGNAVGRLLTEYGRPEPVVVVGVVRDVPWHAWDRDTGSIYASYARTAREPMLAVLLRGAPGVGTADLIARGLHAIAAHDPTLSIPRAGALNDLFRDSVRGRRLQAWLFGSVAAGALAIVGVGIFGLLAMATARRTRELGIRQALGSTRGGVVGLFVREHVLSVAIGLGAGAGLAMWAARFIEAFLYGGTAVDATVWSAAALLTLGVAAIAVIVPAARASRTDPVAALRHD